MFQCPSLPVSCLQYRQSQGVEPTSQETGVQKTEIYHVYN
jgi:hypothetical protein